MVPSWTSRNWIRSPAVSTVPVSSDPPHEVPLLEAVYANARLESPEVANPHSRFEDPSLTDTKLRPRVNEASSTSNRTS